MVIKVKLCGLNTADTISAAIDGGVDFIGLVFYPPSPRYVSPRKAASLISKVPKSIVTVGLFVDPSDEVLYQTLKTVELDMLQLHGTEAPKRIKEIKVLFDRKIIKAIKVGSKKDVRAAHSYEDLVDWLLFDAAPPKNTIGALPGGNAIAFDWELLNNQRWAKSWMLSGGLNIHNVVRAVHATRALAVDISSGIEDKKGVKSPDKVSQLLKVIKQI